MRIDGDCPLYAESHGAGPAVVLGHGFGGSARNFRPQARALHDRMRVVLFDARGHARSAAPADPAAYEPGLMVEDLGRVLDAFGTGRAVVGGLSMGAGIALRFALAHPERVRGLVLAAFPPGGGQGLQRWAHAFADALEREGVEAAGARYVWGPDSGLDPEAARWVRLGFLEHSPVPLAQILRRVIARQPAPASLAPRLAALDVPALLIVGADDRVSRAPTEALAEHLPRARLVEIPGAGHVVNLAKPEAFDRAVAAFLDELDR